MSETAADYHVPHDAVDPWGVRAAETERILRLLEGIRDTAASGLADVAGDGKDALLAIHRWASEALKPREEGARMR